MDYSNQSIYFPNNDLYKFLLYRNIRTNKLVTINTKSVNLDVSNGDIQLLNVHHDITLNNNPYLPIGIVLPFATTVAPQGWLICNGQEVSKVTYVSLWNVIGTTFGVADDDTKFKLPDLRGRVIVGNGAGINLTPKTLGQTGGAETHTLTIDEIPSHTHNTANTVQKTGNNTPGTIDSTANEIDNVNTVTTTSSATGGGQAHNIMQPFTVLNYIIKYLV